ncbi:MAG TPA: malto-oligosyltrehalose synthase, partial [Urbifossiella sp.]|nr:malto-oligosyltrehalose synthase [Urbifossiella sp.]
DTKRSEDARARLNALSELPGEWADRVNRWAHLNARHREAGDDGHLPDRNEEYLLYQTLVAVWGDGTPADEFKSRVQAFTKKALCEAKVHSSWINPDPDYEAAVARFVDRALDPEQSPEFLADLAAFVERVGYLGRVTGLAQTVIRCTAPGVPDTYQGTEGWDFSLVDPDNRRPVDYAARRQWLAELDAAADPRALAANLCDPRAKLFAASRALRARRAHADLFARGEYVPLAGLGAKADHVFAFARRHAGGAAVVVVPRLVAALVPGPGRPPVGAEAWGDTMVSLYDLPPGRWVDVFTGAAYDADLRLPLAEVLGTFPAAVLILTPQP